MENQKCGKKILSGSKISVGKFSVYIQVIKCSAIVGFSMKDISRELSDFLKPCAERMNLCEFM